MRSGEKAVPLRELSRSQNTAAQRQCLAEHATRQGTTLSSVEIRLSQPQDEGTMSWRVCARAAEINQGW